MFHFNGHHFIKTNTIPYLLKSKTTILHSLKQRKEKSSACPILIITAQVPLSKAINHHRSSGTALYAAMVQVWSRSVVTKVSVLTDTTQNK